MEVVRQQPFFHFSSACERADTNDILDGGFVNAFSQCVNTTERNAKIESGSLSDGICNDF